MHRVCPISGERFTIPAEHFPLYEQFSVPPPTLSPRERERRRMSMSCQRHLFRRECAATGKSIVSNFPPDGSCIVYDIDYWHSTAWDQHATAREFDFTRPFFEQFSELMAVAPRPNVIRAYEFDDNADFTNHAGQNKDCYFIFDSDQCRECFYSYSLNSCTDCIDCFRLDASELCFECTDCVRCYSSSYLQNCLNCSDSLFLKNCIGCSNCIGCVNLKNKQYCIFNRQYDKLGYEQERAKLNLDSRASWQQLLVHFEHFCAQHPARAFEGTQNQNVLGDYLFNCKNAFHCFDSRDLEDCAYITQAFGSTKSSLDCTEIGQEAELIYETSYCGFPAYFVRLSSLCYPNVRYLTYCYYVKNSQHCFGCAGLRNANFCVLNTPYSESEYHSLTARIIEHMKQTGEWGEFFPPALAPIPYNLSHAHDFYPLSRTEALRRGYRWWEEESPDSTALGTPPDRLPDADDKLLAAMFTCAESNRKFRLQPAELTLYRKLRVPLPDLHFDVRHTRRFNRRNPRELIERNCTQCGIRLPTTVTEARSSKILCETHFQQVLE